MVKRHYGLDIRGRELNECKLELWDNLTSHFLGKEIKVIGMGEKDVLTAVDLVGKLCNENTEVKYGKIETETRFKRGFSLLPDNRIPQILICCVYSSPKPEKYRKPTDINLIQEDSIPISSILGSSTSYLSLSLGTLKERGKVKLSAIGKEISYAIKIAHTTKDSFSGSKIEDIEIGSKYEEHTINALKITLSKK